MEERAAELRSLMQEGGLRVAAIRMLLYVSGTEGGLDERSFALIRKMRAESDNALTLQEFKDITRDQALMMTLDSAAAIQAMPRLLDDSSAAAIRGTLDNMKHVLEAAEPLSEAARESLNEMERIFEFAERRAQKREQALAPAADTTPAPAKAPARRPVRAAAARSEAPAAAAKPVKAAKAAKTAKAVKTLEAAATPLRAKRGAARTSARPARKSTKASSE
jgi:ABC-type transporter Mla subunit MlaD